MTMDEIDIRIIQELIPQPRATYRELADRLDLSVNAVHKRVQSLVELGIIKEFTVHLSQAALPHVFVRVCGTSEAGRIDDTVERLGKNPGTAMIAVSSSNGLHVLGVLEDLSGLHRFVSFVAREAKIASPSVRLLDLPEPRALPGASLTGLDYRIIASLLHDSRKSAVDVAAGLGVSARTVKRRIERMEKSRLIYYRVVFDHASLGGIFTLLDLYVRSGVKVEDAAALIRKKHSASLLEMRTFSTIPNNLTIDVWTRTAKELNLLQESLQDEGIFEKVLPIFVYGVYHFGTWRDDYVLARAAPQSPAGAPEKKISG
ncbi:MAG: HTH-type transcriptional regulator Ptr2 [Methanocella sp. PtaU1.Bin125]|nr:MAG: HTH-type transcriptional regulator Ptr2 [Methanocella sp. PtaU1.Bin125]